MRCNGHLSKADLPSPATEPCGIVQIMTAEDLSDLQRLLRVTALVLKFVRTMKSSLKKDISSQSESAAQDIMGDAKTMWIKEVQKSLSKNPQVRNLEKAVWYLY